jgi:hypothetical protein
VLTRTSIPNSGKETFWKLYYVRHQCRCTCKSCVNYFACIKRPKYRCGKEQAIIKTTIQTLYSQNYKNIILKYTTKLLLSEQDVFKVTSTLHKHSSNLHPSGSGKKKVLTIARFCAAPCTSRSAIILIKLNATGSLLRIRYSLTHLL